MDKYIWIFPVLFILHDMEEVIWLPGFIEKNREDIIKQYPIAEKLLSVYKMGMTTEAFALAVYEELIVLMAICVLVELTKAELAMGIWYGALIGFTAHLVIHILQSIAIKRYIPSLITSILTLLPSIMLLMHTKGDIGVSAMIGAVIGIAGVAANLKLAHMLMNWYMKRRKITWHR
ncbi:MAG: HXXEE domain-containing protein [Lachnospiraceae bacterium]|nr:HXXEE domain-containing protein [Lachnospiraceae bacterium]